METDGIADLKAALDEINDGLVELVQNGDIDESQHSHLIDWTKRVLNKLTLKYKNVSKGVNEIMGGYILHTRTDDILDQGRTEGEQNAMRLTSYLIQNGRSDDVLKAANDKDYFDKLFSEFAAATLAE